MLEKNSVNSFFLCKLKVWGAHQTKTIRNLDVEKEGNLSSPCFEAFVFERSLYGFCETLLSAVGYFT